MIAILGGSNITSLRAQRRLAESTDRAQNSLTRLSSGMRINRPSDDAASLSVSESLKLDNTVFTQAVRNLSDGISYLNVAQGAAEQLSEIVTRQRELATQAANGSYSTTQRHALNAEFSALRKEYNRIIESTSFNGIQLFSLDPTTLAAGYGSEGQLTVTAGAYVQGMLGHGYVASAVRSANGWWGWDVAAADLNRDGKADIIAAGWDGTNAAIRVELGNGNGTFAAATTITMGPGNTRDIVLADVNNDGSIDALIAGEQAATEGYVSVALGRGDGTFATGTTFRMELDASWGIQVADFNSDDRLDVVTAGYANANDGSATVRLGNGDGTFGAAVSFATESAYSHGVAVGDINGDANIDFVTAGTKDASGAEVNIRLGNGDGTFQKGMSYSMGTNVGNDVQLADLDGDDILDLIAGGAGFGVMIRLGNGDGTFRHYYGYSAETTVVEEVALGDMNSDGIKDLVTTGQNLGGADKVTIRLGIGDGTFASSKTQADTSTDPRGLALADFNGDDVLDVVTTGSSPTVTVNLGQAYAGWKTLTLQRQELFTINTRLEALSAINTLDGYLDDVATATGGIGSHLGRLGVAISTLRVASENLQSANSRIVDADIAQEAANLTALQILQQAGQAVLAQANQQPALALQLMGF